MLYSSSLSYSSIVSTTRPGPVAEFTISFWLKRATDDSYQGYLFGLAQGSTTDALFMYWGSYEDPNDPGIYANKIFLSFQGDNGGYMSSVVNISDGINKIITGVTPDFWGMTNQGNVGSHGYSLITVVVNYESWNTDYYVKWYWNADQLDVPWNAAAANFQESATAGDTVTTADWTGATLFIGGSVPSELSSGCQLDSYVVYISTAISGADVNTLYNSGSVATLTDYQTINNDLIYYNFE